MNDNIAVVVLAAGKGSRMKATTDKNKVTYLLGNKPIIVHTIDTLIEAGLKKIVVVVGFASDSVRQVLGTKVDYATQDNPQGTGHAVKVALPSIPSDFGTVISIYGDDSAFYHPSLIHQLIATHKEKNAKVTLVTIHKDNPTGLGRIIRGTEGNITAIVEEKNATPEQRNITEINTGLYCFNRSFLEEALEQVTPNELTGEYYLTDVIEYAVKQGFPIQALTWTNNDIWHGVNTPEDLKEAQMYMKAKNKVE